jgi:hypothetical protein
MRAGDPAKRDCRPKGRRAFAETDSGACFKSRIRPKSGVSAHRGIPNLPLDSQRLPRTSTTIAPMMPAGNFHQPIEGLNQILAWRFEVESHRCCCHELTSERNRNAMLACGYAALSGCRPKRCVGFQFRRHLSVRDEGDPPCAIPNWPLTHSSARWLGTTGALSSAIF